MTQCDEFAPPILEDPDIGRTDHSRWLPGETDETSGFSSPCGVRSYLRQHQASKTPSTWRSPKRRLRSVEPDLGLTESQRAILGYQRSQWARPAAKVMKAYGFGPTPNGFKGGTY